MLNLLAGTAAADIVTLVKKKDGTNPGLDAVKKIAAKRKKDPDWRGEDSAAGGRPKELTDKKIGAASERPAEEPTATGTATSVADTAPQQKAAPAFQFDFNFLSDMQMPFQAGACTATPPFTRTPTPSLLVGW